jgi:hypothetical protein
MLHTLIERIAKRLSDLIRRSLVRLKSLAVVLAETLHFMEFIAEESDFFLVLVAKGRRRGDSVGVAGIVAPGG